MLIARLIKEASGRVGGLAIVVDDDPNTLSFSDSYDLILKDANHTVLSTLNHWRTQLCEKLTPNIRTIYILLNARTKVELSEIIKTWGKAASVALIRSSSQMDLKQWPSLWRIGMDSEINKWISTLQGGVPHSAHVPFIPTLGNDR